MKVLVLTRSTGEGHNRVSQALKEVFEARGHTCTSIDALYIVNSDRLEANASQDQAEAESAEPDLAVVEPPKRHLADTASQLYGWAALKVPHLFGAVYNIGAAYSRMRIPSPIRLQNSKYADATYRYIEENEYDAVIAPHLFPEATLSAIRRDHPSHVRYYGVLTDYTCSPFFTEPKLDGYFIPHPDMVDDCVRRGLPRNKTYADGIPVSDRFRHAGSKEEVRTQLGLPLGVPTFLVMAGGVGSLHIGEMCDQLLSRGSEYLNLVVLTGRREDLFTRIAGQYRDDPRVKVVSFTDRVADYMAAADVLVSKPGAVSSTEAAVSRVPLVHTMPIPGMEASNARFFQQRGMSIFAPQMNEATLVAHRLIADEAGMRRMRERQARNIIADSAERIVSQIEADFS